MVNRRPLSVLVPCLLCLVTIISCGRKLKPRPPVDVQPTPITNLSASNTRDGIELSWSRPHTYNDGMAMRDLGGFIIERSLGSSPLAPFERLVVLDITDRDRFRQVKRFSHIDTDTNVGMPYRYRVVSFTLDRYFSAPSNVVTVVRTTAPEENHASLPTPQR